jgi:hypothetical protein
MLIYLPKLALFYVFIRQDVSVGTYMGWYDVIIPFFVTSQLIKYDFKMHERAKKTTLNVLCGSVLCIINQEIPETRPAQCGYVFEAL